MKTRIYLVSEEGTEVLNMTDEQFITLAESQGNVWSSWEYFIKDFNEGFPVNSGVDFIREIKLNQNCKLQEKSIKIEVIEKNGLFGIMDNNTLVVDIIYKSKNDAVEEWKGFELMNREEAYTRRILTVKEITKIAEKLKL